MVHFQDFIMQQRTLVIGWVGPALFGILFAAFAWATGVFNWLWSLATWLFSGNTAKLAFGHAWNRVNHAQNALRIT